MTLTLAREELRAWLDDLEKLRPFIGAQPDTAKHFERAWDAAFAKALEAAILYAASVPSYDVSTGRSNR